jgi:hypothetical protein
MSHKHVRALACARVGPDRLSGGPVHINDAVGGPGRWAGCRRLSRKSAGLDSSDGDTGPVLDADEPVGYAASGGL